MPKIPLTKHEKSSIYAQKYPSEFRVLPNGELICKLCDKPVNSDKKFAIDNHRACGVHQNKLRQGTASSSTITSTLSTNSFDADFVLTCLEADIPFKKVDRLKKFLEKYTTHKVPSETQCRRIVKQIGKSSQLEFRKQFENQKVFCMIDETTISKKKYIHVLGNNYRKRRSCKRYTCLPEKPTFENA